MPVIPEVIDGLPALELTTALRVWEVAGSIEPAPVWRHLPGPAHRWICPLPQETLLFTGLRRGASGWVQALLGVVETWSLSNTDALL